MNRSKRKNKRKSKNAESTNNSINESLKSNCFDLESFENEYILAFIFLYLNDYDKVYLMMYVIVIDDNLS